MIMMVMKTSEVTLHIPILKTKLSFLSITQLHTCYDLCMIYDTCDDQFSVTISFCVDFGNNIGVVT